MAKYGQRAARRLTLSAGLPRKICSESRLLQECGIFAGLKFLDVCDAWELRPVLMVLMWCIRHYFRFLDVVLHQNLPTRQIVLELQNTFQTSCRR